MARRTGRRGVRAGRRGHSSARRLRRRDQELPGIHQRQRQRLVRAPASWPTSSIRQDGQVLASLLEAGVGCCNEAVHRGPRQLTVSHRRLPRRRACQRRPHPHTAHHPDRATGSVGALASRGLDAWTSTRLARFMNSSPASAPPTSRRASCANGSWRLPSTGRTGTSSTSPPTASPASTRSSAS